MKKLHHNKEAEWTKEDDELFGTLTPAQTVSEKESAELKSMPSAHLVGEPSDSHQTLEQITQIRLSNGVCPLCGLKPGTKNKSFAARWICSSVANCPDREVVIE